MPADLASFPRPATALVVGASGGLGGAFAAHLADAGFDVHATSRRGGNGRLALDVTDEASIAAACEALARAFAVNAIGPALVAKHVLPRLPRAKKCVFAVLSARVGSISDNRLGGWYGYRASKAALNQIVRTLAIETRRTRPEAIIVALHPGTVATALSAPFRGAVDEDKLFAPTESAERLLGVVDGLTPDDSGGFFAWDGEAIAF